RTLEGVTEKGEAGERLVAGTQDVGCADIARADGADIAEPAEARQEQAEGNRAEQIAGGNGGEKPRIGEVEMHAAKAPVLRRSGGSVFIDGASGNQGAQHPPVEAGTVEGRILGARAQRLGVAYPGRVRIDDDGIGRRA